MNSLFVISPYKINNVWMFDDESVGLLREPFVCGVSEMIDEFTKDIPNAANGINLFFSANPFPGATIKLEWKRDDCGGNWYFCPSLNMEGWFCPALFHYFEEAPKFLYGKVEAKKGSLELFSAGC